MDLLYQKRLDAFCIVSSDSDFTRLASRLRESEMFVLGMGEQKTPRAFISACNKFVYLDLLHKTSINAAKGKRAKNGKKKQGDQTSPKPSKSTTEATPSKVEESTKAQQHNNEEKTSQHQPQIEQKIAVKQERDTHVEHELADEDFNGLDIITVETALREIAEEFSGDDGWILSSSLGARLARRLPDFDTRNFGFKKFVPFIESLSFFESKSVRESENSGVKTVYFRLIEE